MVLIQLLLAEVFSRSVCSVDVVTWLLLVKSEVAFPASCKNKQDQRLTAVVFCDTQLILWVICQCKGCTLDLVYPLEDALKFIDLTATSEQNVGWFH